jgi:hypothetical protein
MDYALNISDKCVILKMDRSGKGGDRMQQENPDQSMIEKVLQRLDTEVENGVMRVTVEFDDKQPEAEKVSHKGCKAYGQDAAQTVGKLDAYSDQLVREMKEE